MFAELGLDEEAYAAVQEVLHYDPEFSIPAHSRKPPRRPTPRQRPPRTKSHCV
jgi:hypothetical protein